MPLSPRTFTIAEAAEAAGYDTFHAGKWHLGEFFPKARQPTYAGKKWPVSNPSVHGFSSWHSTEASAPSSTLNCGCKQEWWESSPGCITGGGVWSNRSYRCMNYWFPNRSAPNASACADPTAASLGCVANLTEKVAGDDTEHIMDQFESFLRAGAAKAERRPFLAALWLHSIHEPHPALPEFYSAYTDAFGDLAGDYLGTRVDRGSNAGPSPAAALPAPALN